MILRAPREAIVLQKQPERLSIGEPNRDYVTVIGANVADSFALDVDN
jgi:hypothetical protein